MVESSFASSIARCIADENPSRLKYRALARAIAPRSRRARAGGLELDGAMEEGEPVFDLVATHREIGGAAEPGDGSFAHACDFLVGIGPREVEVVGPNRFCVVVRQQSRVLVSTLSDPLEPGCEARVEARTFLRRKAFVGDFAGQRVLDGELALADDDEPDR